MVTGEWAEDAKAVLEGLITAHFPDARVEAPRPSPVFRARGCDWGTAKNQGGVYTQGRASSSRISEGLQTN